ncbi:MAG: Ig-like domain-containing protein, partial [Bacteroidales bacterium]
MKNHLHFVAKKMTSGNKFLSNVLLGIFIFMMAFVQQLNAQNCSVNSGVDQVLCPNEALVLHGKKSGSFPGSTWVKWTQVSGPAAVITSPNSLESTVTNFQSNTTLIFRLSTQCLDGSLISQDVEYQILPAGIATAGSDSTYCPGTVAYLSGNAPGPHQYGVWTGFGNGITAVNPNLYNTQINISASQAGATTLRWTIIDSLSFCTSYDDVVITNLGGVTPVSAGSLDSLGHCYSTTQSGNLSGSYAGIYGSGQGGTWTIVSGPTVPVISNIHANNSSVSGLIQGTYVFRWTVNGSCVSGTALDTIVVPPPTATVTGANAGNSQVFCDGRDTAMLSGNAPVYINERGLWVQTGGPALPLNSIVNPTNSVTQVINLDGHSTYTFRYTIYNDTINCSSSSSTTISYMNDGPTISITTKPIILPCNTNSASVPYTVGGSGVTQYSIISGPAADTVISFPTGWLNVGGNPQIISGLNFSGTYVVQLRRFTTVNVACSSQVDEVSITTSFGGELANAGTDQILDCNVVKTDLQGNDPLATGIGEGTWSQIGGPTVILISHPNHHHPILGVDSLQIDVLYSFLWYVTGGANCPDSQDTVTVRTSSALPEPQPAGVNQLVCFNTPVYLHADSLKYKFLVGTWTVSPSTGVNISDIHSETPVITGLQAFTTYTFYWTVMNGCGETKDSITVDVNDTYGPVASAAGSDRCLSSGTTHVTLNANDPSPGTGIWNQLSGALTDTITSATLYNTTVTGLLPGTYSFEWVISRNSCPSTRDTVVITVNDPGAINANAGSDVSVCGSLTTLTATGSNPAAGATAHWSQLTGNGGPIIATPNNPTTIISNLHTLGSQAVVYNFLYTITNGACISKDTVAVFVSDSTSVANIALDSIVLCGSSSVSLSADTLAAGSGSWSVSSGPNTPAIVSPSLPTTTINNLVTGTYYFRWTVNGGPYCSPTYDSIKVKVTINANAGNDQSYCEVINAVNLSGTTSSSGSWTQMDYSPNTATITPTSSNTATASGLIPGVYHFIYNVSALGCSSSDTMKVTLYTPPSIAAAGPDDSLCGQITSTFTMAATVPTAGIGTWTKLLGPAGETGNFNNDTAHNAIYTPAGNKYGVYVFQWTVANNTCSNADQVRITYYQEPSTANAGSDQSLTCATSVTMAATNPAVGLGTWTLLSKTGDSPTPTITNPLLYNSTITGLGPKSSGDSTTYTFLWTVTNGVCASKTDTVNIRVFQTPTPAYAGVDQSICNQTSVTLTATPLITGTGSWTLISPTQNTETFTDNTLATTTVSNIIPGTTYKFRWHSATSFCSSSDTVTVINYQMPTTANATATVTSYCNLEPIVLTGNIAAIGTGTWTQIAGDPLIILSPNNHSTSAVGGEMGKSYTFRWTISNLCGTSQSDVTVAINNLPPQAQAGPDLQLCAPDTSVTLAAKSLLSAYSNVTQPSCYGEKGSVFVYGIGGIYPYTYKLDGGTAQASGSFIDLSAGNHSVIVTDNNSCKYTVRFSITVPNQLFISKTSQTNVSCRGAATASVLLAATGGTPAYTFSVKTQASGGSASVSGNLVSGMKAGTYTLQVTDANLCSDTLVVVITQPATVLSVSGTVTNPVCHNGIDGSINTTASDGISPYAYEWSNGSTDADPAGLAAANYSVIVTDANGCTISANYTVSNPAAKTLTASNIVDATLCNTVNGSVKLEGSVAGSVSLIGGTSETSPHTYTGLQAGRYTAVFTSSTGGCNASANFEIKVKDSTLTASANVTNPSCYGSLGSVTINTGGGVAPYTYLLDGSTSGSGSFSGLTGGIHNVLVTDNLGCTYIVYFTITIPSQLTISLSSQTNVKCYGASSGTALVKASGGSPAYSFSIFSQPGGASISGNLISNMVAGNYTIRVSDANGCNSDQNITITQPGSALNITSPPALVTYPSCHDGSNGSIDITVSGGSSPYTFVWNNGSIAEDLSGLSAGNYSVTATDANGCNISGGIYTVYNPSAVIISQSALIQTSCLLTTGSVVLTTSDASSINLNGLTKASGSTFDSLGAGIYIATSNGSCPANTNINFLNYTNGLWTVASKPATAQNPVFADSTSPTSLISGLVPGIYKLVWSNINGGCSTTDTMKITVYKLVTTANAGPSQTLCNVSSFTLHGNAVDSLETGTWVRVSGPNNPTITSPNDSITTVTGVIASTTPYVFRWKITQGLCPTTEDTVSIINRKPITLAGPVNSAICVGGTETLYTIASNGSGSYNYLWQYKNGLSWDSVGNSTSYVTPVLDTAGTYYYRITVSDQLAADNGGCSIIDTAYVMVVNDPIWATNVVTPDSICTGGQVSFNATISGGLGGNPVSWIRSNSPGGAGITVTSPDIVSLSGTYYYRPNYVAFGHGCNLSDDTDSVLVVIPDPAIVVQPKGDTTICSGTSATLSVSATGGTPYLTYQWQKNITGCGGSWTNIPGATDSTYTTTTLTQTTYYHVVISATGSDCNTITSSCATVHVPRIITQPIATPDSICVHGSTLLTVATELGSPAIGYTYQWQYYNGASWNDVSNAIPAGAKYTNATTASLSIDSITPVGNHKYRVVIQVISPVACTELISDSVIVTVKADPFVIVQPIGDTICNGSTSIMNVLAGGGTPTLYYQWQISTIGSPYSWSNIGPNLTTSTSLTTSALTANTWYRVKITSPGSDCNTVYTDSAKITVNNLNPGTIAQPDTVCEGGTPLGLISSADATPSESGAVITYKWQSRTASTSFADITPPATNNTYAPGALTEDTWYRRIAYSTFGASVCQAYSDTIKIVVNNLTAGVIAGTQTICSGDDVVAFTVSTAATGDGALTYQWQISSDSITFTDISLATAATYNEGILTSDRWYQRITTSTIGTEQCFDTSNIIRVYVNNLDPGSVSGGDTICRGGDPALISSVAPYSGDGSLTYQWYYRNAATGFPPTGWTAIASTNTATYDPPSGLPADRWYSRLTTSLLNGKTCTAASNLIRVTVNNVASGSIQLAQTICDGSTPALLTTLSSATKDGDLTYQWQISTTSATSGFADISPNGTNETYQPLALTQDTWFRRKAISTMNTKVCDSISTAIKITVNNFTSANTISTAQTICNNTSASLTGNAVTGDGTISYQWQSSSTQLGTYTNVSNTGNTQNYTTVALTADTWFRRIATSTLTVVPQAATACDSISAPILVTVNNFVTAGIIAAPDTVCETGVPNGLTSTSLASGDGVITYRWQNSINGTSFSNLTSVDTLTTYQPLALTVDTWYRRVAISTLDGVACELYSDTIKIVVNNLTAGVIASAQTICSGDNVVAFTVPTPATGDGTLSYQWQSSPDSITFTNIGGATASVYDADTLMADRWYQRITTSTTGTKQCSKITNILKVTVNNLDPGSVSGGDTICRGGDPALISSVAPYSGDGSLTYQWYYRNAATGFPPTGWTAIASTNTATYDPPSGLPADRWYSRLTTSLLNGKTCTAASNLIRVTVNNVASGSIQLAQTICDGSTPALLTTLSSATKDGDLTYQWQISTTSATSGFADISPNGTNETYQPLALTQDTWFRRKAISTMNTKVCDSISTAIKITVNNFTSANTISTAQTICNNTSASLTGNAVTGDGTISYQWQSSSTQLGTYTNVSNTGNTQNYTTVALTADTWFRRIATSTLTVVPQAAKACDSISAPILVTVNNFVTAGVIEAAQTICETNTPAGLTSSSAATADGVITYRWQNSINGTSFSNLTPADTLTTYQPLALTVDTWYRRVAISTLNSVACELYSDTVKITVNNLTAGTIAATQTICESTSASLTGTLPTFDGTVSYQWESSLDSISWGNATGTSTNQNYTTAALVADTWFRRVVKSTLTGVECTKTSTPIKVTVNNITSPGSISISQTVCESGSPILFISSADATGDGSFTYQWQSSTDSVIFTNIVGATSTTYQALSMAVDTFYRRVATSTLNGVTCSANSNIIKATVNNLTPGTISASQTICDGATASLTGTLPTADGVITYQWESSLDSIIWGNAAGVSTNQNYTTAALSADTWYRRVVTSTQSVSGNPDLACSKTSNIIKVTVNNFTLANVISGAQTICNQGIASLTGNAVTADGAVTYQWQSSSSLNGTYSNVSNAGTSQNYTTLALSADTWFRRIAISTLNSVPCELYSDTIKVTVVIDPIITIDPSPITICSGTNTTLSVVAIGGTPSLVYQWETSANGISGWSTVGTNSTSYLAADLTQTTYYRVVVSATGIGCTPYDTSVVVGVHIPHITIQPLEATICKGGKDTLTVAVSSDGGTATYSYQWQVSALDCSDDGFVNISTNSTSATYITPVLNVDRYYRCIITSSNPNCTMISDCAPVYVVPDPTISVQPTSGTICSGTTYTMSVVPGNGTGSYTYQWKSSSTIGGTYTNVIGGSGANTDTYTTASLSTTTYYKVVVSATGAGCGEATSLPATVTVIQPATAYAGLNHSICSNNSYSLSGTATNYSSLLWTTSGTGTFNNLSILNPIYTPSAADITAGTVNLTLNASAASPCTTISDTMTLTINIVPTTANAGPDKDTCGSISTSVTMAANSPVIGGGKWNQISGAAASITTATSPTTKITGLTYGSYSFRWVVGNGVCDSIADTVMVTVSHCCPVAFNENVSVCNSSTNNTVNVLNGDNSPGGGTLTLTTVSGPLHGGSFTYTSGTSYSYTPLSSYTGNDTVVVQWCDNSIPCCKYDTVFITVAPKSNAGNDFSLCNASTSFLVGNNPSTGIGFWGFVSGPSTPVIYPATGSVAIASNLVSSNTSYVFSYTMLNSTCNTYDEITITNYKQPTQAFAGVDQSICGSTPASITMAANTPIYGNGVWTKESGAAVTITDTLSPTTTITGLTSGTYSFRWTITNGICQSSSDLVTVTIGLQAIDSAGRNDTICEGATYIPSNATASNYTSLSWSTCSNGCGNFDNNAILHPTFTPSASDILNGYVKLKLTAYSQGSCPSYTSIMTLTINKQAVVNAGNDATICQGTSYTLFGSSETNATSMQWTSNGDGSFVNSSSLHPVYTPGVNDIANGTVKLALTGQSVSPCVAASDTMVLTINKMPIVFAGTDDSICSTISTRALTGATSSYASTYQWTTSGTGSFTNATTLSSAIYTPTSSDVSTGQVQLTITATNACGSSSDFKVLTIWPSTTANAGPATASICSGSSYTLTGATATNYTSLSWVRTGSVTGTFDNSVALNPVFTPTSGQSGTATLTLTATKLNGSCSDAIDSIVLTINASPTLTAGSISNTTCNNSAGSVLLTGSPSGGTIMLNGVSQTSPHTYSGLTSGYFTATYTAANTCTTSTTFQITNSNSNLSGSVAVTNVSCNGGTGSVVVTATGGTISGGSVVLTNGYRYSIDGGSTQATTTFSGLSVGSHIVKIIDDDSCNYLIDFMITQPSLLKAVLISQTNVSCNNGANGIIEMSATGGTAPYTYSSPGLTFVGNIATGVSYGTHTITVTDTNSCSKTLAVTIVNPTLLTALASLVNDVLCYGAASGSASVTASNGTPPYTYLWSNGSTSQTATGLLAGTNSVTVTDHNGCTASSSVNISQPAGAITVNAGIDTTICSSAVSYILAGTASHYTTLLWTTSGTGSFGGNQNTLTPTYTPSAADIASGQVQLTLTATANSSCASVSDYMVLNIWPAASANAGPLATICSGNTFVLTGATAINYNTITWSSTGGTFDNAHSLNPTFTPTTTGDITLTLTATGLGNCSSAVSSMTLTVNPIPTIIVSDIVNTTCNASVGSVKLTSSNGDSIVLNGVTKVSGSTFSGLLADYYTVSTNGSCPATTNFSITNTNSTLSATVSFTDPSCYGFTTTATITATGGTGTKTFLLNGTTSNTDGIFTGLTAGAYVVKITDANGCSYTLSFDIDQPNPLTLSLSSQTNVLCNGSATGNAIVIASGGTTAYTYSVFAEPSGGSATVSGNIISGMKAGAYIIRVTDYNGCIANLNDTITQPSAITATASTVNNVLCYGASTGSVTVAAGDGTPTYTYLWNTTPVQTTATATVLSAGTYTVT